MDASELKEKYLGQEGQAIFEFIVFVPFYIYLLTVLMSFGNSLNASINQNKAIRGYYYRVAASSSRLPTREDLEKLADKGIEAVGMGVIGYQEKEIDAGAALAGCVGVQRYIGSDAGSETCEEPEDGSNQTRFVRIFTAYGTCGESWRADDGNFYGRDYRNVSSDSCVVR